MLHCSTSLLAMTGYDLHHSTLFTRSHSSSSMIFGCPLGICRVSTACTSVLIVPAGLDIPTTATSFIFSISHALADAAPNLTLEVFKEWTIGFSKADTSQKTACLSYVVPWVANLDLFSKPCLEDGIESRKQVVEIIRSLVAITTSERRVSIYKMAWGYD